MTASKLGMSIATAVLLAGAAVGQAQQARAQQAQKAPQAGNAAAVASSATTSQKATPATPSAAKSSMDAQPAESGLSAELLKEARDDGYKPVTRGKATLYCKSEILVGSAFPIHTCYNADRLKIVLQQYEAERMQLRQMHSGGLQGH